MRKVLLHSRVHFLKSYLKQGKSSLVELPFVCSVVFLELNVQQEVFLRSARKKQFPESIIHPNLF
jgi:hypothetical protein